MARKESGKMNLVVDSREKRPWSFPDGTNVRVGTVRQGDYSLDGDNTFAIERKSMKDFRGTVVREWDRFQRELIRMDRAGFCSKVIIVECDFADFCFKEIDDEVVAPEAGDDPVFTPELAARRVAELLVWNRTSVLFAHDEGIAAALAYQIFLQRSMQMSGKATLPRFN